MFILTAVKHKCDEEQDMLTQNTTFWSPHNLISNKINEKEASA